MRDFDWESKSPEQRFALSKRWFMPFRMFKGFVRLSRSSGKPHYHVPLEDGGEACITHKVRGKTEYYLLHVNGARPKNKYFFNDAEELCDYLEELGPIYRDRHDNPHTS